MHNQHGKSKLISQPSPDQLQLELTSITIGDDGAAVHETHREVVDATDCTDPSGSAHVCDPRVYHMFATTNDAIEEELMRDIALCKAYDQSYVTYYAGESLARRGCSDCSHRCSAREGVCSAAY